MLKYLNHSAIIKCAHDGQVQLLPPPFRSFHVQDSPILTDKDLLLRAMIVGCKQMGPGLKPCTKVTEITLGRARDIQVDGEIPLLEHLQGLTDGNPPGLVFKFSNPTSNAEIGQVALDSPQVRTLMTAKEGGIPFCEICAKHAAKTT